MDIVAHITVEGGITISDANDDNSPLTKTHFYNEAAALGEDAKKRLAVLSRSQLTAELIHAGILVNGKSQ